MSSRTFVGALLLLAPALAAAQKAPLEISASGAFTLNQRLVDTTVLALSANYGAASTVDVGGALMLSRSGPTDTLRALQVQTVQRNPASEIRVTDDLNGLWQLKAAGLATTRWRPVTGRLGWAGKSGGIEVTPWLGAGLGLGLFHQDSAVACLQVESRAEGTCSEFFTQDSAKVLGMIGGGLTVRPFRSLGFALELRDLIHADTAKVGIDRLETEAGRVAVGDLEDGNSSLNHLVQLSIGISYLF